MRILIKRLILLYPRQWRARYESELQALFEDVDLRWIDAFDILRGGLSMQLARLNFLKAVTTAGVLGAAIAAAWTLTAPSSYTSAGLIASNLADRAAPDPARSVFQEAFHRRFLYGLIRGHNLYPELARVRPMEDLIEKVRGAITIERDPAPGPNNLRVQFSYPDPAVAQRVNQEIINQVITVQQAAMPNAPRMYVLTAPSLPDKPIRRSRGTILGAGLLAGLLAGALYSGLRRRPLAWSLRVAAFGLVAMLLAAVASYLAPARYRSSASMRIDRTAWPLADQALSGLSDRRDFDAVAFRKTVESPNYVVVELTCTKWDRFAAQRELANASNVLSYVIDEERRTRTPSTVLPTPDALRSPALEIVDPPTLPQRPLGPGHLTISLMGLGLGLLAGAFRSPKLGRLGSVGL